jgi:hypothetical protein
MIVMIRFSPVLPLSLLILSLGAAGVAAQAADNGFRDPQSGKVWTPDNVGQDGKPVAPADRAFDPSGQVVSSRGVIEQHVPVTFLTSVPITAGPSTPLVEIGEAALRVIPGDRWEVSLQLTNNSAEIRRPILACRFMNHDKVVEEVRVVLPDVQGGTRVGFSAGGPRGEIYVDRVSCAIASS